MVLASLIFVAWYRTLDREKLNYLWAIDVSSFQFWRRTAYWEWSVGGRDVARIFHPTQNVYWMRRYRQMGEIAYVAERQREAMAFIREDYARFMGLNAKRSIYYWGGVPRSSEIPALAPLENLIFLASSVLAFWGWD